MGLDMYLSATKFNGGGYTFARMDYVHDPEHKRPAQLVPKAKRSKEVRVFDAILRTLGFGKADDFLKEFPECNSIEMKLAVGYWRKANAIHQWFVTNVQNGVDDCRSYDVEREQLETLRDTCQTVLDVSIKGEPVVERDMFGGQYESFPHATVDVDAAKAVLPTQQGFFFGSYEYDQWYILDLESTVEQINRILNDKRLAGWDFEYRSSW